MKQFLLSAVALISIWTMAKAESAYETIFNNLPNVSNEQLATPDINEERVQAARAQLEASINAANIEMDRQGRQLQAANTYIQQQHEKMKPTQAQMQAAQAIGGDMMAALAAAGISPAQMAKMSDDEIAAILMPLIAQKTGLSTQEMQAMQGMTDAQAEAYMRQGDRAKRAQNSEYGSQYGQTMQGMNQGFNISEEDDAKLDQIIELAEQINENIPVTILNLQNFENQLNLPGLKNELDQIFEQQYQPRIEAIINEFYERVSKEPAWKTAGGNGMPTPAYGKEYYAKVNAVVDEYNTMAVNRWNEALSTQLNAISTELSTKFQLCNQKQNIYKSIASKDVQAMASQRMNESGVHTLLTIYINMLATRLEAPVKYHYTMPTTVGGMG